MICCICTDSNKAMYELDTDPAGFEWINKDDTFRSIFSFVRHSRDNKKNLLVCLQLYADGTAGLPGRCAAQKAVKLVLDSDEPNSTEETAWSVRRYISR